MGRLMGRLLPLGPHANGLLHTVCLQSRAKSNHKRQFQSQQRQYSSYEPIPTMLFAHDGPTRCMTVTMMNTIRITMTMTIHIIKCPKEL